MTDGDQQPRPSRLRGLSRGLAGGALVFFTVVLVGVAVTGAWLRAIVFDEDRFVETVAPIGRDDDVQAALALWAGNELRDAIDLQPYIEDILPERADALAGPLSSAFEAYLAERAGAFFESDRFSELWEEVTVRAHAAIIRVLKDESDVLDVQGGEVKVNLVPILSQVLETIETQLSEITGREINIPEIGPGTQARESITRLADALGRELPEDFGQLTVFEESRLDLMQVAAEWFNRLVVLLVIAAAVLIGLSIYISTNKRRLILSLALGIAFIVVVLRRITFATQSEILGQVKHKENEAAVNSIVDQVFNGYRTMTVVILVLCALAVIGTLFKVEWYRAHAAPLRIAVAGAVVLVLLLGNLGLLALFLVVATAIAIEIALTQLLRSSAPDEAALL